MSTTVEAGQVWADNDKRTLGRTFRVVKVDETHASCIVLTPPDDFPNQKVGNTTRIRLSSFKPTSTGYVLLTDAEEPEGADETATPHGGDETAVQVIAQYIAECAQITVEQAAPQAMELVERLSAARVMCVELPEVALDQFDDPAVRLGRDAKVVALDSDRIGLIDIATPFPVEQVLAVTAALLAVHEHVTETAGR